MTNLFERIVISLLIEKLCSHQSAFDTLHFTFVFDMLPSYGSIASILIMNSLNNNPTKIIIDVDFHHGTIRCRDNSKGISPYHFTKLMDPLEEINNELMFKAASNCFYKISKVADIDIQTKMENEVAIRRFTFGKPQICSPFLSYGTEIIVSSIFKSDKIKESQNSDIKSKKHALYAIKAFINTISLSFLNVEFQFNGFTIPLSKTIEERWKVITGTSLKISKDEYITIFKSSIGMLTINLNLQITPFLVNNIPVLKLVIDGKEYNSCKNALQIINGNIKEIYFEDEYLSCEMSLNVHSSTILKCENNLNYMNVGNALISELNVIGIFNKSYIICYRNNILYAVDQHAAHERVNLERLINNISNPFSSFELKTPFTLPCKFNQKLLPQVLPLLKRWGWNISSTSSEKSSFYVFSVPIVETIALDEISSLLNFIDQINQGLINNENQIPDCIMHALQTRACKKSIKFGDFITLDFASKLIHELSKCKRPNHCAHGRTVVAPLLNLNDPGVRYDHV